MRFPYIAPHSDMWRTNHVKVRILICVAVSVKLRVRMLLRFICSIGCVQDIVLSITFLSQDMNGSELHVVFRGLESSNVW